MPRGKSESMAGMLRELHVELEVTDINGARVVYADVWHAPDPLTLAVSTGSYGRNVEAVVRITDPLKDR